MNSKGEDFMIPQTTSRVEKHTPSQVNAQIHDTTEMNIRIYSSDPKTIDQRLKELEQEWDIERLLEANGSALLLLGLALGVFVNRRWLLLPMFVGGFCLQHAIQGWCPPIEAFRRFGVRTSREIERERVALKAIRGDFESLPVKDDFNKNVQDVVHAVSK
jgi:hypothetical protein